MKTEIPKTDIIQWAADTSRLLKVALRSHDPEMVSSVQERISERLGPQFAEKAVCDMITHLMDVEDWSFVDPQTGEASPLL